MIGPWGRYGMMGGGGFFGGLFALLLCVLFLAFVALVAWLIVRLVRSAGRTTAVGPQPAAPAERLQQDPVLEALRRRLAEGAITPEEFDQLREKLGV